VSSDLNVVVSVKVLLLLMIIVPEMPSVTTCHGKTHR